MLVREGTEETANTDCCLAAPPPGSEGFQLNLGGFRDCFRAVSSATPLLMLKTENILIFV